MIAETESIYQIFLRNFTEEGTFRAAIPALQRIANMGFTCVYLTPIHPIGKAARKGTLGSPYAIANYREINPELGTLDDWSAFVEAAHVAGLKVMIDVVYNHTSPDSELASEHPDWFLKDAEGNLARKCADWSDVVDLDYAASPHLWMELIDTLQYWRDQGADGFRCDVASLVPADFWRQARQRVNRYDPGRRAEQFPVVWLAESVHPSFLRYLRNRGFGAWSEPELHAACFDLTYDYDGWERLEAVWKGSRALADYHDYLYVQETLYPRGARKIRYLENHDQKRAAARLGRKGLRAWTAWYQFLPGVTFAYMGQEYALQHTPSLFEHEPITGEQPDMEFAGFFARCLKVTREVKALAPYSTAMMLGPSTVLLARAAKPMPSSQHIAAEDLAAGDYLLIANLAEGLPVQSGNVSGMGRSGDESGLPFAVQGQDLLAGEPVTLRKGSRLDPGAVVLLEVRSIL